METNRFETFYDAILAIVITILVLKIPHPANPTWGSFFSNHTYFITYFIVFLAIINIWFSNMNIFHRVDKINNRALVTYGVLIFLVSLFPYFASWLSLNLYSLTAETIFGLLIISANISNVIALFALYGANKSSEKLSELNIKKIYFLVPLIIEIIGFIISYTVYVPGIYFASILSVILSVIYNRKQGRQTGDTERFEALIDAIIAIIITVIVLEIPQAVNGNLASLLELKLEFIAYAISFIVCFNMWDFTYNLFAIINKINYKSIWAISASLFFLSLIPYLTIYVSSNFNEFAPQCIYGLDFIIIALCSIIATRELKKIDEDNHYLQTAFQNYNNFIITIIITAVFIIIGYFYYPPIILMSCLFSIILTWIFMYKKINLLNLI